MGKLTSIRFKSIFAVVALSVAAGLVPNAFVPAAHADNQGCFSNRNCQAEATTQEQYCTYGVAMWACLKKAWRPKVNPAVVAACTAQKNVQIAQCVTARNGQLNGARTAANNAKAAALGRVPGQPCGPGRAACHARCSRNQSYSFPVVNTVGCVSGHTGACWSQTTGTAAEMRNDLGCIAAEAAAKAASERNAEAAYQNALRATAAGAQQAKQARIAQDVQRHATAAALDKEASGASGLIRQLRDALLGGKADAAEAVRKQLQGLAASLTSRVVAAKIYAPDCNRECVTLNRPAAQAQIPGCAQACTSQVAQQKADVDSGLDKALAEVNSRAKQADGLVRAVSRAKRAFASLDAQIAPLTKLIADAQNLTADLNKTAPDIFEELGAGEAAKGNLAKITTATNKAMTTSVDILKAVRTILSRILEGITDDSRLDHLNALLADKETDVEADKVLKTPGTYDPSADLDNISLPIGKSETAEKFKGVFEELKSALITLAKTGEPYARAAALFAVDADQKKLVADATDKFLLTAKDVEKGVKDIVTLLMNVNKEKDGEEAAASEDTPPEDKEKPAATEEKKADDDAEKKPDEAAEKKPEGAAAAEDTPLEDKEKPAEGGEEKKPEATEE